MTRVDKIAERARWRGHITDREIFEIIIESEREGRNLCPFTFPKEILVDADTRERIVRRLRDSELSHILGDCAYTIPLSGLYQYEVNGKTMFAPIFRYGDTRFTSVDDELIVIK